MLHLLLGRGERTHSYTIHERPDRAADRVARADALKFVRDGFSWPAFLWAPGWLIEHRIWTGLLGYVAVFSAIACLGWLFNLPLVLMGLVLLAVHLLVGSEADEMQRAQLSASDWTMIGQVTGTGPLDCERRFFDRWLATVPGILPNVVAAPAEHGANPGTSSATGSGATVVAATPASGWQNAGGGPNDRKTRSLMTRSAAVLGNLLAPRHRGKD